ARRQAAAGSVGDSRIDPWAAVSPGTPCNPPCACTSHDVPGSAPSFCSVPFPDGPERGASSASPSTDPPFSRRQLCLPINGAPVLQEAALPANQRVPRSPGGRSASCLTSHCPPAAVFPSQTTLPPP